MANLPQLSAFSEQELLGTTDQHVCELPSHSGVKIHVSVVKPLQALISAAQMAGFDLRVASGFRGFDRQRLIWNKKCLGEKPVLDANGCTIETNDLSSWEKIQAILHWSALPGASRHHWGTECDIFDAAAIDESYQLRLHPDEYGPEGVFGKMMQWLIAYLAKDDSPDFYLPYWPSSNGVMAEPWHISYRPVSTVYEQQYTIALLERYLESLPDTHRLMEQDLVIEKLQDIHQRYIQL